MNCTAKPENASAFHIRSLPHRTPFRRGPRRDVSSRTDSEPTVTVAEVLPEFADAFPFEEFNRMQSAALPALLNRDDNVVVSAPTASGKTALAELAICKTLAEDGTALFLAPLRALTTEKETEWERFEDLGYSVYVVTGERDLNPRRAARADILVMTPEKTDSATRKHDSAATRSSRTSTASSSTRSTCWTRTAGGRSSKSPSRGSAGSATRASWRCRRRCRTSTTWPTGSTLPTRRPSRSATNYRPVPLHADVKTYTHGENAFADCTGLSGPRPRRATHPGGGPGARVRLLPSGHGPGREEGP